MDTLLLAPRPAGKARATSNTRRCIGVVAAPRRCPTSPSSRRLASARPALAPKCPYYFLTDLKPELQTPFSVALWLNRRAAINNDFFLQTGLEYIMGRSSTPIRVDPGGTQ